MKSVKGSKIRLERGELAALRIALIYVFISAIWIVASDRLLLAIFRDPNLITSYQTLKGWLFILLSGGLIFVLARREYIGWMRWRAPWLTSTAPCACSTPATMPWCKSATSSSF